MYYPACLVLKFAARRLRLLFSSTHFFFFYLSEENIYELIYKFNILWSNHFNDRMLLNILFIQLNILSLSLSLLLLSLNGHTSTIHPKPKYLRTIFTKYIRTARSNSLPQVVYHQCELKYLIVFSLILITWILFPGM